MSPGGAARRVVAAISRDLERRIGAIVNGWELCVVQSGAQLASTLERGRCDMLIVGVHFDESSAVSALQQVLARDATFPVVCVRGVPFRRLGESALHALRMALGELGAQNFIDLLEYPDDQAGNARVRAMLERLIASR
jgi:hypothetical protein